MSPCLQQLQCKALQQIDFPITTNMLITYSRDQNCNSLSIMQLVLLLQMVGIYCTRLQFVPSVFFCQNCLAVKATMSNNTCTHIKVDMQVCMPPGTYAQLAVLSWKYSKKKQSRLEKREYHASCVTDGAGMYFFSLTHSLLVCKWRQIDIIINMT
jgi:hypothetical protein